MAYKEIKRIQNNPSLKGMAHMIPDIVFSTAQGTELKMQLLKPWVDDTAQNKPTFPLIVFVQGSAWTFPDVYYELPQLAQLAREGYVVATLTHRNCLEGNPFPAFLQDIKTGIRFLRKNAAQYQIDPNRVGIWGTSSGGNTALLVGLTADDPRYETEEYAGYSDKVKLVVDCFGPACLGDMLKIDESPTLNEEFGPIFRGLLGGELQDNLPCLFELDPMNHIEPGKTYPPFLLLHGDNDMLVDYSVTEKLFHKMLDATIEADMVCIEGAPHEGSFWSEELLNIIREFIQRHL